MYKQQFEEIVKWQDSVFTKATPLSCVNHLLEEVVRVVIYQAGVRTRG